jgi:hypothetical protein
MMPTTRSRWTLVDMASEMPQEREDVPMAGSSAMHRQQITLDHVNSDGFVQSGARP